MTITLIRHDLNQRCHDLLDERGWKPQPSPDTWPHETWTTYRREIAGLPVDLRNAGLFLGLAYMLERAGSVFDDKPAHQGSPLTVPHWIIHDLRRLAYPEVPAEETCLSVGEWVTGFAQTMTNADYMRHTDRIMRAIDVLKAHAKHHENLANYGSSGTGGDADA